MFFDLPSFLARSRSFPSPCAQGKEDNSALDAVCRSFSEKTKGAFAPATMVFDNEHDVDVVARKSPAKQKVEESRLFLRKKLKQGNGVTLLSIRQFVTYVAPVRFVPSSELNEQLSREKGEVEWIGAHDLFAALYSAVPDNIVTIRAHPYDSATTQSTRTVSLPLALPFTVTMRTPEARVSAHTHAHPCTPSLASPHSVSPAMTVLPPSRER